MIHSVMCDGATDKGILENEAVCCRVINSNTGFAENHFVGIVAVQHAHADGVLAALDSAFDMVKIFDINRKTIALTAEGVSVNLGCKHGVQAKLRKRIPHLIDTWCMPHRWELASNDSIKGVPFALTILDTLELTYKTYKNFEQCIYI